MESTTSDTFKARDKSTTEIANFYNDIIFIAMNRKDKAETDSFRETCQGLLDILPVPNDDEK